MFFKSNISFLRKRKKQSQQYVADSIGMSRATYNNYEHGLSVAPYDKLIALAEHFSISVDVLLKTDLSQFSEWQLSQLERTEENVIAGKSLRVLSVSVDATDNENIEVVNVGARAGYTTGYADPEFIAELPKFNLPFLPFGKSYRTFQIEGDSMPPVAHDSYVIGEYVENWNDIRDGKKYIIVTRNEGIVFKVTYNKIDDKGALLLCSTNPAYAPYYVDIGEIVEVWRAMKYIVGEKQF